MNVVYGNRVIPGLKRELAFLPQQKHRFHAERRIDVVATHTVNKASCYLPSLRESHFAQIVRYHEKGSNLS